MKVLVLASWSRSLVLLRGHLLAAMVQAGHEVVACGPEDEPAVRAALGRVGVRFRRVGIARRGVDPLRDAATLGRLVALLRAEGPDVFLGYTAKPVIYGCLAARLARVPRVYALITGLGTAFLDDGGSRRRRWLGKAVRGLYRVALRGADSVIFQNPDDRILFLEEELVPSGVVTLVVNGSGVDLGHYAVAPLPEGPPSFLCVARLVREKGVGEYAAAARLIGPRAEGARFRLVGPAEAGPSAIPPEEVAGWQRDGVLEVVGEVDDVRPWLREASVYVLPSYREGTPRSVLEAMSMGRAVVTTEAPGCRETVVAGETGLLVKPRSVAELATAMEEFVAEPELAGRMGAAGRRLAEEKFDVHRVNEVLLREMGLA